MNNSNETLKCAHVGQCGGCAWGLKSLFEQKNEKLTGLQRTYTDLEWVGCGSIGLRDRADLVWQNIDGHMQLGLYGMDSRDVVNLTQCPMMTPALEAWFQEFRQMAPPIQKGSVRLRVSPAGERGVWLDFANQDVKDLFDQTEYLKWLSSRAYVEVGQRRKKLIWNEAEDRPKLIDAELKPWFQTYDAEFNPIPLYGPVGGFSQTGFKANLELVKAVTNAAIVAQELSDIKNWVELFCGNGNFALALAARGHAVTAVEMDELALSGLELSLRHLDSGQSHPVPAKITIQRTDVYLKPDQLPDFKGQGLLVDPPRAGLREVLNVLEQAPSHNLPGALIYVSCFTDVFVKDQARLEALGYTVQKITGVEQFPHSPHNEWVALFTKVSENPKAAK